MTLTGEYAPVPEITAPPYPTIFGVTLTPTVSGALIAVAGFGLAAYLGTQMVLPALDQMQTLNNNIAQKEADVAQKAAVVKQVNEVVASLNRAKAQNQQVRGLFSTQEALGTLLLDLNQVISKNQARLLKFEPDYASSGIVSDGSIGPELNGKLKRQVTNISFQGTFPQTLNILKTLDRLQTLLVIQNFTTELKQTSTADKKPVTLINSSFKLVAYVPLTPEELAAAAPPPAEKKENAEPAPQ